MKKLLFLAALGALALGLRRFGNAMSGKEKKGLQARKLEIWEGEGGAVPVAPARTAAQVSPRKAPPLSPRGVRPS